VSLHPDAYWAGVDLHPDDIVVHVNGMPLETPNQAYAAMESLRTADHVTVEYLRGGVRRELTYRILAKPGAAAASSAAPVASQTPAP
jgi:S1-C subfamily serine protease